MTSTNCTYFDSKPMNRAARRAPRLRFINDPGSPGVSPRRRLVTVQMAADYLHVIPRTVRNHISRGLYPGYKIPGARGIRVDLNDIDRATQPIATTVPREARQTYGGNIITLDGPQPRMAEYVRPVEPKAGAES